MAESSRRVPDGSRVGMGGRPAYQPNWKNPLCRCVLDEYKCKSLLPRKADGGYLPTCGSLSCLREADGDLKVHISGYNQFFVSLPVSSDSLKNAAIYRQSNQLTIIATRKAKKATDRLQMHSTAIETVSSAMKSVKAAAEPLVHEIAAARAAMKEAGAAEDAIGMSMESLLDSQSQGGWVMVSELLGVCLCLFYLK